jgi:hypothetical protein
MGADDNQCIQPGPQLSQDMGDVLWIGIADNKRHR